MAGFVARRIVCNLKEGDSVHAGDRFGMIKFGSRCDVFVNRDWEVKVKVGDNVTAGETILFQFKPAIQKGTAENEMNTNQITSDKNKKL